MVKFLCNLKHKIEDYYKHKFRSDTNYCANYEDLYYMTGQIHDSEVGEYYNPAVQPLVSEIALEIKPLLEKPTPEINGCFLTSLG